MRPLTLMLVACLGCSGASSSPTAKNATPAPQQPAKPETRKPESTKRETQEPETPKPAAPKPEAPKSEAQNKDTSKDEIPSPENDVRPQSAGFREVVEAYKKDASAADAKWKGKLISLDEVAPSAIEKLPNGKYVLKVRLGDEKSEPSFIFHVRKEFEDEAARAKPNVELLIMGTCRGAVKDGKPRGNPALDGWQVEFDQCILELLPEKKK